MKRALGGGLGAQLRPGDGRVDSVLSCRRGARAEHGSVCRRMGAGWGREDKQQDVGGHDQLANDIPADVHN